MTEGENLALADFCKGLYARGQVRSENSPPTQGGKAAQRTGGSVQSHEHKAKLRAAPRPLEAPHPRTGPLSEGRKHRARKPLTLVECQHT